MDKSSIFQKFENQRVLIVGDVMLDRYLVGSVSRISPEAPVPVVLHRSTDNRLGGAANVALNVRALGGEPVLCSVIGADDDGRFFREILPQHGISDAGILASATRKTTVKTRVLGGNQQMLRIDHEDTHDLSEAEQAAFLQKIRALLDGPQPCSVIVFQDYNKGVLTEAVISEVIGWARQRGIPTAVDPKFRNFFAYRGVGLFKPNLKEIRDSASFEVSATLESLTRAARFLQEKLQNRLTMITLSEKGLFLDDGTGGTIYPTQTRNVADVSGAGDTVISVAAMGLAAGLDLPTIAALSNLAGGQVCQLPGVVPVNLEWLKRDFFKSSP